MDDSRPAQITAFVPCRKGSQRIPNKNTRPFAADGRSLFQIKISDLMRVPEIDQIVVSTDDPSVVSQASAFSERGRLLISERPKALASSTTPISELCRHVHTILPPGFFLWTHVTSPFFGPTEYTSSIAAMSRAASSGYDSVVASKLLQNYIFNGRGIPLHEAGEEWRSEIWPPTQSILPMSEINNAVFMGRTELLAKGTRLGQNPHFLHFGSLASLDIDWPEDWDMAQRLWDRGELV